MAGADGTPRDALAACGLRRSRPLPTHRPTLFAAGAAALFLVVAWLGPKPWDAEAARRFAEQKPRPEDYASLVFFWVALGNTVLCGLLVLTARWWGQALSPAAKQRIPRKRWEAVFFWLALILVASGGLLLRLPMATKSLWWDEVWTVKNAVVGYRSVDESGQEKFIKRDWARTFWHYSKPTNHVGFSVLSRCSVDAWRQFTKAQRWEFHELAYRLPSLLAGVGSIFLIGWLARDLLGTISGLGCATVLAAHPWFIRYSVDGRAFGLTVFFVLLAWLAVRCILRDGTGWGWWIVYAVAVLMVMWVFPYNVYFPLALTIVCAFWLALLRSGADRARSLMRLAAVNVFAMMVFLQLAGPWIPQALVWKDVEGSEMAGPVISRSLLEQTWLSFALGLPRHTQERADPLPSYLQEITTKPWLGLVVWWGLPALALLGLLSSAARTWHLKASPIKNPDSQRILLSIFVSATLALGLALIVAFWKRHYYYDRYVIYFLPGLIVAVGAGLQSLGRWLRPAWLGVGVVWSIALGVFLIATQAQRSVMLSRPLSPVKDVAAAVRQLAGKAGGTAFGYGLGGDTPSIYEPSIRHGFVPEKLLDKMNAARAAGRALFVFYGYESFNRANSAGAANDAFRYLDDPLLFIKIGEHRGIEDQFTYSLFRYTGVDPELSAR